MLQAMDWALGWIHHPLPLEEDLSSNQEGSSRPTTTKAWFHQDKKYICNSHKHYFSKIIKTMQ